MALVVNGVPKIPKPVNSPFVGFARGTKERESLVEELSRLRRSAGTKNKVKVFPLWINGLVRLTDNTSLRPCVVPHDFARVLGYYAAANEEQVSCAIETVLAARKRWSELPWFMRLHIFRKAARLLETKYLIPLVAAVMEDYSKNAFEAFIDVQELIDFLNFNSWYAYRLYKTQPDSNTDTLNLVNYRPLEGFVFAVSPNNFIAINGNLCTAPLIMGNVVVAKPSSDVVCSFHLFLRALFEAGLPHDVLAVLHGDSKMIGDVILNHRMLSGVHFTGGTETFNDIWRLVGSNIERYRGYPRIVGETGGKDPIVVYDDHDPLQTAISIVVGGFGAQGRKCSATSRVYMTPEMYAKVRPHLQNLLLRIKVGDVADFRNYMGAIINEKEYKKIIGYVNEAYSFPDSVKTIMRGRRVSASKGWFVEPTVIVTDDPNYRTVTEEIFGPVVTICLISRERFNEVLSICDKATAYALTGAVHTADVFTLCEALQELRDTVGNIYDDRTTAAVVNQQPFSGGRKSGTNSKVGWWPNLLNWTDMQTICLRNIKTSYPPACLDE